MRVFSEVDVVKLREAVKAIVIGEHREVLIPSGAEGTVVLVHGDTLNPAAYEVEFYIQEQNCFALATVEAALLEP